jgi:hypothetical protein
MGSATLRQCTWGKILAQVRLPHPQTGLVPTAVVEFAGYRQLRQTGEVHLKVGDGGAGGDSAVLSRIQPPVGAVPRKTSAHRHRS